jgi:hypothetical protein
MNFFIMRYLHLFFFIFSAVFHMAQAQTKSPSEKVVISSTKNKTLVRTNDKEEMLINVSEKDARKFKVNGFVRYSDFGAKGNGKTDDIEAISATHAFANKHRISVKADEGATYYISGKDLPAVIQTDTDFGNAAFIIDDKDVQNRNTPVFVVSSNLQPFRLEGISALKRNQEKTDVSLPGTCLVTVTTPERKSGGIERDTLRGRYADY